MEVLPEGVVMFVQACEWPEDIDVRRAEEAKHRAEERIRQQQSILRTNLPRLRWPGQWFGCASPPIDIIRNKAGVSALLFYAAKMWKERQYNEGGRAGGGKKAEAMGKIGKRTSRLDANLVTGNILTGNLKKGIL